MTEEETKDIPAEEPTPVAEVVEEPVVEAPAEETTEAATQLIEDLVAEFKLTRIDVSDVETVVLTKQQVAELTNRVKVDISTAKKVGDVLAVLKTIGGMALSMGALAL